jgi:hypothetical protein
MTTMKNNIIFQDIYLHFNYYIAPVYTNYHCNKLIIYENGSFSHYYIDTPYSDNWCINKYTGNVLHTSNEEYHRKKIIKTTDNIDINNEINKEKHIYKSNDNISISKDCLGIIITMLTGGYRINEDYLPNYNLVMRVINIEKKLKKENTRLLENINIIISNNKIEKTILGPSYQFIIKNKQYKNKNFLIYCFSNNFNNNNSPDIWIYIFVIIFIFRKICLQ